ncbi:MAG: hypothetical protein IJT21_10355 [Synergistaceae bacterium]|nr:hypothetical protein [Synergistaceae bacterium]
MKDVYKLLKSFILFCVFSIIIAGGVALLMRTSLFEWQKIFLYRLMYLEAVCCVVLLCLMIVRKITKGGGGTSGFDLHSSVMTLAISALFTALFFSVGIVSIDRSYTIYYLSYMNDNSEKLYSTQELQQQFIDGYLVKANETQKRISEQLAIGNIEQNSSGKYRITEKGKRLIKFFRTLEFIFPCPDKNSIYPVQ